MNLRLPALLIPLFTAALISGCAKSDEAVPTTETETVVTDDVATEGGEGTEVVSDAPAEEAPTE